MYGIHTHALKFTRASIHGIADHAGINDVYDRFGPVPRLCIDIFGKIDQFEQYKVDVCKAISNITLEYLARLFEDASSLHPDDIFHKICLISRKDRNNVASVPIASPITSSIQTRLAGQIRKLERQDQIRLYKRFEKVPDSRGLASILFEAAAQNSLGDGMQLDLIRMVRKSDPQPGDQPQWHSSHLCIADPTLEGFRQEAIKQGTKILIDPSQVLEYDEGGLESITSNVYYVPELTNTVALDSFILQDGRLYIFQFTVGHKHDIKEGLLKFQLQCTNLPPIGLWCFVFIVPPNLILKCPYPRSKELQKLHLYSAVVVPKAPSSANV
ncbi:hypothetical protein AX14_006746 [Amanita brunnescens Koide BX004]|nr:hypothetical protein AX14_006746 [Amanita brunnescens Koide BX004]